MDSKDNKVPDKDVKNGGKDIAQPKDEVGPYVPDKRGYFAGLALQGACANAALHRSPNVPAFALQMADLMLEEMRKPPIEEQQQQAQEEREERVKAQREQREAEQKLADERDRKEREEREKAEKEQRERDKQTAREQSRMSA